MPIPQHLRTVANEDGAAVLDIPHNQIATLNTTGGFVWEELRKGCTLEQIVHDLSIRTSMDEGIVERDVARFLDQLQSNRLFER